MKRTSGRYGMESGLSLEGVLLAKASARQFPSLGVPGEGEWALASRSGAGEVGSRDHDAITGEGNEAGRGRIDET